MGAVNREITSLEDFDTIADGGVVVIGVGTYTEDGLRADMSLQKSEGEWYFPAAPFGINPAEDLNPATIFPAIQVYERDA